MSTLKVAAINNPSASSGGLAISASGNVTGAGLDLITTQSFSAVSSVSVNNCFSGDYEHFKILVRATASTSSTLLMRLTSGGTQDTTTNYNYIYDWIYSSSSYIATSASQTSFFAGNTETTGCAYDCTVFSPFAAAPTGFQSNASMKVSSTAPQGLQAYGGHSLSSSYDGLTIYPASGTITGTVSVYGYKK